MLNTQRVGTDSVNFSITLINQNDGKQKDWRSYWYGPQGVTFNQMRRLVNERPDASLTVGKRRLTPMQVWNAYKAAWQEAFINTHGCYMTG